MNTARSLLASWAHRCWAASSSGYTQFCKSTYHLMNFKTWQGKWEHGDKKDLLNRLDSLPRIFLFSFFYEYGLQTSTTSGQEPVLWVHHNMAGYQNVNPGFMDIEACWE